MAKDMVKTTESVVKEWARIKFVKENVEPKELSKLIKEKFSKVYSENLIKRWVEAYGWDKERVQKSAKEQAMIRAKKMSVTSIDFKAQTIEELSNIQKPLTNIFNDLISTGEIDDKTVNSITKVANVLLSISEKKYNLESSVVVGDKHNEISVIIGEYIANKNVKVASKEEVIDVISSNTK